MDCCKSWAILIRDATLSTLILLATTLYRAWIFTIFLSVSIGPSVVASRVYEYFGGQGPPPLIVEPSMGLVLLSYWAEVSVHVESRFCGTIVEKLKLRFPSTMSFGRFCLHLLLYLGAYVGMHMCFVRSHTIPFPEVYDLEMHVHAKHYTATLPQKIRDEREVEAIAGQETWTVLFLGCLAYLVFVTARNFHKDLMHIVRNLPPLSVSVFNNCLLRFGFTILHFLVNLLYFIPCLAMAYTSTRYKTDATTAYFQLTFCAGLTGIVAALLELNRPWPQQRGRMPCLSLEVENNVFGKTLLCRILIIPILMAYYQPFEHPKVVEPEFDSGNQHVFWFNVSVCFAVLHVIKLGTYAVLSLAQELDVNRFQPREVIHLPPPAPLVRRSAIQIPPRLLPPHGLNACNEDVEANQCPSCANVLNNNNQAYQSPPSVVNDDNNENNEEQGVPVVSENIQKSGDADDGERHPEEVQVVVVPAEIVTEGTVGKESD